MLRLPRNDKHGVKKEVAVEQMKFELLANIWKSVGIVQLFLFFEETGNLLSNQFQKIQSEKSRNACLSPGNPASMVRFVGQACDLDMRHVHIKSTFFLCHCVKTCPFLPRLKMGLGIPVDEQKFEKISIQHVIFILKLLF